MHGFRTARISPGVSAEIEATLGNVISAPTISSMIPFTESGFVERHVNLNPPHCIVRRNFTHTAHQKALPDYDLSAFRSEAIGAKPSKRTRKLSRMPTLISSLPKLATSFGKNISVERWRLVSSTVSHPTRSGL